MSEMGWGEVGVRLMTVSGKGGLNSVGIFKYVLGRLWGEIGEYGSESGGKKCGIWIKNVVRNQCVLFMLGCWSQLVWPTRNVPEKKALSLFWTYQAV